MFDNELQQIIVLFIYLVVFLVLKVKDDEVLIVKVCEVLVSIDDLIKNIVICEIECIFICNVVIGYCVWQLLVGFMLLCELKLFCEIKGVIYIVVFMLGDLLYYICVCIMDLIVVFECNLLMVFGDVVEVVDDVVGFCYFDGCDLFDFVDGIVNLEGLLLLEVIIVGDEDLEYVGGSYVVVQKYLYNFDVWCVQKIEVQEVIIGCIKYDNIELDDVLVDVQKLYKMLCIIEDVDGEYEILCDNMLFVNLGCGEYGIYFIGYMCCLWVIEKMFECMFIGNFVLLYDCIFDFFIVIIGVIFFVFLCKVLVDLGE